MGDISSIYGDKSAFHVRGYLKMSTNFHEYTKYILKVGWAVSTIQQKLLICIAIHYMWNQCFSLIFIIFMAFFGFEKLLMCTLFGWGDL